MIRTQREDVSVIYAGVEELVRGIGFSPVALFEEGLRRSAGWFEDYYE